jgi:hypothetical protein
MEEDKIEHIPKYFEVNKYPTSKSNPLVKIGEKEYLTQFRYNRRYFE